VQVTTSSPPSCSQAMADMCIYTSGSFRLPAAISAMAGVGMSFVFHDRILGKATETAAPSPYRRQSSGNGFGEAR